MRFILAASLLFASGLRAQNPVADAMRRHLAEASRNLVGAAEAMPDSAYAYRPTPEQWRFGQIVEHVAESNDWGCAIIGGRKPPSPPPLDSAAGKPTLVARLRASFAFCESAMASLTDAHLGATVWTFPPNDRMTRARAIVGVAGDWEDHYAQMAMYLRLNRILPPTAQVH
jgi:DinB superfamily